jgi:branched-chain amino acid aminotransferase
MPIQPTPQIWMNGRLVDWDKAQVHVLTHTLHYGTGVFEGMRAYETDRGPAVFRLTEHVQRLFRSAHIMGMEIPYSVDELVEATRQTVASTGLSSCYVRPIAYYGYGEMGLNTLPCVVDVAIACWPWNSFFGDEVMNRSVRMKIASWSRHDHNSMPPAAKTTGNYVNSSLAKVEALRAGYDEAIMLASNGLVAECTGENIFVVRNGIVLTPPISAGALEGITQNSVMTIARDLGYEVRVDNITRSDLYIAEEIFVCGTAAEVSSVSSVDDRSVPCPGPIGTAIAAAYNRAVRGQDERYRHWCDPAIDSSTSE